MIVTTAPVSGSQTGGFNQAGEGPGGFHGGPVGAFSADDIGPEGGPDGPGGPGDCSDQEDQGEMFGGGFGGPG